MQPAPIATLTAIGKLRRALRAEEYEASMMSLALRLRYDNCQQSQGWRRAAPVTGMTSG
jgi:hypothetical protein